MGDSDIESVDYEPETFLIGGHSFNITTIAYLPIEQLMINRTKDVEISGQKLWCGSLGMIQHIMNNPHIVENAVVIELGAGTGVLGMMCKHLGADTVVLTDHDTISLNHMNEDIVTNDIDATVAKLDWYSPQICQFELEDSKQQLPLVLVAGDVLYKSVLMEPFFNTVKFLFKLHEQCSLLLCHIPRAGNSHENVTDKAREMGFSVEEVPAETWNRGDIFEYCDPDDLVRARIYCLKLIA